MKLKQSLLFCFIVWMEQGGHGLKEGKHHIVMRKANKSAKIEKSDNEYLELNDYAQERYFLFLQQWFKHGIEFLYKLTLKGEAEIRKILHRNQIMGMMK